MLAISLEEESSVALVEGYRVAGKTGTAEISGPDGYTTSLTNASFVGWGPVDDPRFIVYIWLEKPTSSPWGSVVAAPVFSEVVRNWLSCWICRRMRSGSSWRTANKLRQQDVQNLRGKICADPG